MSSGYSKIGNLEIQIGEEPRDYYISVDGVHLKGVYDVRIGVAHDGATEAILKIRCPKISIKDGSFEK